MSKVWRIALAGEGGQGVQVIGEILAEAAYIAGKEAIYIPNFGVEQRGGVSIAFVQISDEPIGAPKFEKADILVPLSKRAIDRTRRYIKSETLYIFECSALEPPHLNDQVIGIQAWDTVAPEAFSLMVSDVADDPAAPPVGTQLRPNRIVGIPAAQIAKDEMKPRVFNVIILGAIVAASQALPADCVKEALVQKLGAKFETNPELKDLNFSAFDRGMAFVEEDMGKGAKS